MNEQELERKIKEKGLTAPRITPEQIDAQIVSEDYHIFAGTMTTICCLKLQNGFAVTGEAACISEENFDANLGREIAKDNARAKVWMLEGYVLANLFMIADQS